MEQEQSETADLCSYPLQTVNFGKYRIWSFWAILLTVKNTYLRRRLSDHLQFLMASFKGLIRFTGINFLNIWRVVSSNPSYSCTPSTLKEVCALRSPSNSSHFFHGLIYENSIYFTKNELVVFCVILRYASLFDF